MKIEAVNEPAVAPAPIPVVLREIPPIDVSHAIQRRIELTIKVDGKIVEMGINGVPEGKAPPFIAHVGDTEVWTLVNNSDFAHPFHLHGYFFQVLDDTRVPVCKDTVSVPVKSTVQIAVRFDERPGIWMFHCHILDHAAIGMMGHLQVLAAGQAEPPPGAAMEHRH
jgi:FtsP/CotA-like multicopper oxidase with cupredoxin domain